MSSLSVKGKLKKVMQGVEGTGQVSEKAMEAVCLAVDGFVQDLVENAVKASKKNDKSRVDLADFKEALEMEKRFDFLRTVQVEEPVRVYRPSGPRQKKKQKTEEVVEAGGGENKETFDSGTYFIKPPQLEKDDQNESSSDDDFDH